MRYKYSAPKYFTGQIVSCEGHRGNIYKGKIIWVETHYSIYDHKAYHIYAVCNLDTLEKRKKNYPSNRYQRLHHEHLGEEKISGWVLQ